MNFFHEWFLNFEQKNFGPSAKNFRPTYQNYIPRIQIHFQRRKCFFDRTNLSFSFFRKLIEKVADFGRRVFTGLAFQRRFHQKNVFLKNVLEFFSDLEPTEFRNFGNLFSMGVGVLERQSTCLEYLLEEN